eukprot:6194450-Pleurochrysis_carterae.AAC.3
MPSGLTSHWPAHAAASEARGESSLSELRSARVCLDACTRVCGRRVASRVFQSCEVRVCVWMLARACVRGGGSTGAHVVRRKTRAFEQSSSVNRHAVLWLTRRRMLQGVCELSERAGRKRGGGDPEAGETPSEERDAAGEFRLDAAGGPS